MSSTLDKKRIDPASSWQMFNDISAGYDFLNQFLSFGLDRNWRKQLSRSLPEGANLKVLDLATGTGETLISLLQNNPRVAQVYGIDLAQKMLTIAQQKIEHLNLKEKVILRHGDANQTGLADNSFDAVTIAFGIRNVANPIILLKEMHRLIKPGGRALILEFSLPQNFLWRMMHLLYLRTVVPVMGGLFSGNFQAYFYLNRTIEKFPYGIMFSRMMKQVGFAQTSYQPLLGGVATIYQGDKS